MHGGFFMRYTTYDVALKMKICEEYATTNTSYRNLAEKYNVKLSTVASWVQKYKASNSIIPSKQNNDFYEISPNEFKKEIEGHAETQSIPFAINGVEITTNTIGIKLILEAILK